MTSAPVLATSAVLLLVSALYWGVRLVSRPREQGDGAPSLVLLRRVAAIDVAAAALFLSALVVRPAWIPDGLHLWRQDLWVALLIGALAGFFLHVVGGGSPLLLASFRSSAGDASLPARGAAQAGTAFLVAAGEAAMVFIWFGVALATFSSGFPRLVALPLVAVGYGLRRAAAGEDHPILGTIDGLLLGLLGLALRALVSVLLAHVVADVLAYVSAMSEAEDSALGRDTLEQAQSRPVGGRLGPPP